MTASRDIVPVEVKRVALAGVLFAVFASGCGAAFVTVDPTYVSDRGATVNGFALTTTGGSTEYWVRYGETTAYGQESAHRSVDLAASTPYDVSVPLAGLNADTTYHYRLCAVDSEGGTCSPDATLTTGPAGGSSTIAFVRDNQIIRIDPDGNNQIPLTSGTDLFFEPAWSPDGRRIAFRSFANGHYDIWLMNADGTGKAEVTDDLAGDYDPAWSPDGSKIAFESDRDGNSEIYVMDVSGDNIVRLTENPADDVEPAWSPNGKQIAFVSTRSSDYEVWVMNADGTDPTNITNTAGFDHDPSWSPDGRRIAFATGRASSNGDIYVMDADGSDPVDVSAPFGFDATPSWAPSGTRLVWISDPGTNNDLISRDLDGENFFNMTGGSPALELTPAWSPRP
jgi:Tol biopolymer transport system component